MACCLFIWTNYACQFVGKIIAAFLPLGLLQAMLTKLSQSFVSLNKPKRAKHYNYFANKLMCVICPDK